MSQGVVEEPDVQEMRSESQRLVAGRIQAKEPMTQNERKIAGGQEMPSVRCDQKLERSIVDDLKQVNKVVGFEVVEGLFWSQHRVTLSARGHVDGLEELHVDRIDDSQFGCRA